MTNFEKLTEALKDAADAATKAAVDAIRAGDHARQAVGSVVLAGVSTNAAIVSSVPVEIAIAVSRRLPFADSQSICNAASDASREAVKYVPYLVTIETLFIDPTALALGAAGPAYGALGAGLSVTSGLAKATIMLTLLAEQPDFNATAQRPSLQDIGTEARGVAQELLNSVKDLIDPADLLIAKPFDEALIAKLDALREAVDDFLNNRLPTVSRELAGLLAGIPKIFDAAVRGAERMHSAVDAQTNLLCGSGRQPARAFFERRDDTISLDRTYPSIAAGSGSWALLVSGARQDLFAVDATGEQSRAEFGLTGKTTELTLERRRTNPLPPLIVDGPFGIPVVTIPPPFESPLAPFDSHVRTLTVFAESEEIPIGERPLTTLVEGSTILLETFSEHLAPGQSIIVSGLGEDGMPISELATVAAVPGAVTKVDGRSQIELSGDLEFSYVRASVRINANVAPATHGESVREVLGSGNAGTMSQRFALKQTPVTHVAAGTESGRATTLAVRVNDLLWAEVPTLIGHGPRDRVFATRTNDEGKTTVLFGNGVEGALPPSGPNNVRASYRKGLGTAGNLGANRLTTLLTRPAGLASVTNPLGSAGGEDPESIALSRANAPMTVRTLERAVSLTDYEDFATTFAGIGKALATWLPGHGNRGILLTIAAADGSAVDDDSATTIALMDALRQFGDPLIPIDIVSFRPVRFEVKATITIAHDSDAEIVMPHVRQALQAAFSFEAMAFAESISIDDVMAAVHRVSGVIAVDIDALYRSSPAVASQWNARIDADGPVVSTHPPLGAELLMIAPGLYDLHYVQLKEATAS